MTAVAADLDPIAIAQGAIPPERRAGAVVETDTASKIDGAEAIKRVMAMTRVANRNEVVIRAAKAAVTDEGLGTGRVAWLVAIWPCNIMSLSHASSDYVGAELSMIDAESGTEFYRMSMPF